MSKYAKRITGGICGLVIVTLTLPIEAVAQNTFPSTGNVGIGTTSPTATLQIDASSNSVNGFRLDQGMFSMGGTAAFGIDAPGIVNGRFVVQSSGSVGIGTTTLYSDVDGTNAKLAIAAPDGQQSALVIGNSTAPRFALNGSSNGSWTMFDFASGGWTAGITQQNGNVGIGTTSPVFKVDVSGAIHATGAINASGGVTFPDGSTQTTAYNPALCGGDYAESVDVTGERPQYEPGDVLMMDPDSPGKFLKSSQQYSTLVAGIYSTKPGFTGRRQITPKSSNEIPMAMIGIVPTKVTAENGAIKIGDLLVASSTPGRAMKGTDLSRIAGAVIGKALGSLDVGTGVIEVLVTLQ